MNLAPLIQQEYVLAASHFRVWDLLAASIMQSLPIERTEIVNDSTVRGVLKFKLGPVTIPLDLKVEVVDVTPMTSFATRVTAAKSGITMVLRVIYQLIPLEDEKIQVRSTAIVERAPAWMALATPIQKSFAAKLFEDIRKELERAI
jgi:hypothetical protein